MQNTQQNAGSPPLYSSYSPPYPGPNMQNTQQNGGSPPLYSSYSPPYPGPNMQNTQQNAGSQPLYSPYSPPYLAGPYSMDDSTPVHSVRASQLLRQGEASDEAAFQQLVRVCKTTSGLATFAAKEGFLAPQFTQNELAKPGNAVFDRFFQSLREILKKQGKTDTGLEGDAIVQVVFHGTRPENVQAILGEGLDPNKRRGQAHGVGEYFSRRPNVSLSYCNGGTKMLVFAVVVPKRCLPEQGNDAGAAATNHMPASYVVVPTAGHQIPIGVLSFEGATAQAVTHSNKMRAQLKGLQSLLEQKEKANIEANLKARILTMIFKNFLDTAGEMYCKHQDKFSETTKREISMFAHGKYDSDQVFGYFGDGLPQPFTVDQFSSETVLNVDNTEEEASTARKNYLDAEKQWKQKNPLPDSVARSLGSS